jgi:hypothetical protein
VRCHAGGRGDEIPRAVLLGGREVAVWVERSWIEEPVGSGGGAHRRLFQVRVEDGRRCRLAQEPDGSWTLERTQRPVVQDVLYSASGNVPELVTPAGIMA